MTILPTEVTHRNGGRPGHLIEDDLGTAQFKTLVSGAVRRQDRHGCGIRVNAAEPGICHTRGADDGQGVQPAPVVDRGEIRGRDQFLSIRMLRRGQHAPDRPVLDDLALVHHKNPLAYLGDHRDVVGDQQQRGTTVGDEVADELQHLGLRGHIERRGRFVAEQ